FGALRAEVRRTGNFRAVALDKFPVRTKTVHREKGRSRLDLDLLAIARINDSALYGSILHDELSHSVSDSQRNISRFDGLKEILNQIQAAPGDGRMEARHGMADVLVGGHELQVHADAMHQPLDRLSRALRKPPHEMRIVGFPCNLHEIAEVPLRIVLDTCFPLKSAAGGRNGPRGKCRIAAGPLGFLDNGHVQASVRTRDS